MVCYELVSRLLPEERRRVLEYLIDRHGLTLKELSDLMGVSPAAVSRYVHGSLAVPPDRLCKALEKLEPEGGDTMAYAFELLWESITSWLRTLNEEDQQFSRLLERMADDLAMLMALKRRGRSTSYSSSSSA